jgi:hypothetical protein
MYSNRNFLLVLGLIGAFAGSSSAVPVWTETVDGDLSGNRLAPTAIGVSIGSNEISGTTVGGDIDYFTIEVPANTALEQIRVVMYDNPFDRGFLAIQTGSTITEDPNSPNVAHLLGWVHLDAAFVGGNVLDDLGKGAGAIGFSGLLGPGTYSFWLQQLNTTTDYTLDFVILPEPGAAILLALGLAALAGRRRARG